MISERASGSICSASISGRGRAPTSPQSTMTCRRSPRAETATWPSRWMPRTIAFAMHRDSTVADNTNVDIYLIQSDGSEMRQITTSTGADNTPRFSPDGRYMSYLSMERAGFEADRLRLMLIENPLGRSARTPVEATAGWNLSVGSYSWCPNSKCIYAVVEERGRDKIYRVDLPSFRRSVVVSDGVNTAVQVGLDNRTLVYLHQTNSQPAEVWLSGKALTHHN